MTVDLSQNASQSVTDDSAHSGGTTAAHQLVRQLEGYGVEYIFGLCGHTNIAFLDALADSSIEFITFRHEQTAAHAADGYARESGKPGVVLTHVGPGMMNAVTGVASAAMDSVPLVVISGDIPSYYRGRHPHQEVNLHNDGDQAAIYRPFVKRAWTVHRVEDLGRFVERAFWTATTGRPGATLVSVPMDMFSREGSGEQPVLPPRPPAQGLAEGVGRRIAEALAEAESPVLYIGGGVGSPEGRAAAVAVAEHLDIPIVHSLMAKGAIADNHPLVAGMPGFWGAELTNRLTREADLVLAVGTRFAETDASSWDGESTWAFPPSRLIQIDLDPAEIGRNYPVEFGVVGDATEALQAVAAALTDVAPEGRDRPELREQIATSRAEVFSRISSAADSDQMPLRPQRILADLRATVPANTVLVTDVGWNKNGIAQCYELPAEGRFITPGGSSTMGFGPAAALGVQVASPDRPVVALIGDGGLSAQLAALPTAAEQALPVIFVVMNNASHGTISDLQSSSYGRSYGCDFTGRDGQPYSPDFAALGAACGLDGYRVEHPDDLQKHLQKALENRRPAVIDVPMVNEPVPTPGHWNIKDIYRGDFA
ncbi:thiamine pyrophosphate-binding protein [Ornithinimicrobium sp. F0845]|uniref:thiamine pyrophosphate-binding protein n=1 Tax=Ornithinimicrobium sp. F0845 TaxID=2926412 RepID=UPI001FF655CC|nr:thiamine pyrophosphate-binding protein [Ornithinimicrobium sp. F0845]MCK0112048.1 thiamine pyrophosphate-binding protein [Ornithinimicrobium sp. F0845]